MNETIEPKESKALHAQIVTLLPWYVNDTLEQAEHLRVQAHLQQCGACRKELEALQQLAQAVQTQRTENQWQPGQAHLKSLMDKIDGLDPSPKTVKVKPLQSAWERICRWFDGFNQAPSSVRWTLAAQSALVVVLSVVITVLIPDAPENTFQTFSTEAQSSNAANNKIRVVFEGATSLSELSILLTNIHATIVKGPSKHGVYTVEIPKADLTAALLSLRQSRHVKFSEPVMLDE